MRPQEPGSSTCRTCGKPLLGGSVCQACGAAQGEANRCPHCGVLSGVERGVALGFRCLVCGGPRLPLSSEAPELALPAEAGAALGRALREHRRHRVLTAAGLALLGTGGLALLTALLTVVAAGPGLLVTLLTLLACCLPLGGGFWALWLAAGARSNRGLELHSARLAALAKAQAVLGPLDAERAARLLQLPTDDAELLLAELSVSRLLSETAMPQLRIDDPAALPELEAGEQESGDEASPVSAQRRSER